MGYIPKVAEWQSVFSFLLLGNLSQRERKADHLRGAPFCEGTRGGNRTKGDRGSSRLESLFHSRIANSKLVKIGLVPGRVVVVFPQLRAKLLHLFMIQFNSRLVTRSHQRRIFDLFRLNFSKIG